MFIIIYYYSCLPLAWVHTDCHLAFAHSEPNPTIALQANLQRGESANIICFSAGRCCSCSNAPPYNTDTAQERHNLPAPQFFQRLGIESLRLFSFPASHYHVSLQYRTSTTNKAVVQYRNAVQEARDGSNLFDTFLLRTLGHIPLWIATPYALRRRYVAVGCCAS